MTYELAKELKEAGFPQTVWKGQQLSPDFGLGDVVYAPTLSELIEACGDELHQLRHYQGTKLWKAKSNIMHGAKPPAESDFCSTPEEAVARLWLALNKK